ncbi:MAG: hypothetical protein Q9176_003644 [Flavoplaca citrina]
MSLLNTPTKADNEIWEIQRDLSSKWGLRFPQPGLRSPAKRRRDLPEEKALDRLRYLYFHDLKSNQTAKDHAIYRFEETARNLHAGWVAKPKGDPDVLPTRTRSGARRPDDFLAKQQPLNDEQASDLMQALLRSLTDMMESVKKGAIYQGIPGLQEGEVEARDNYNTPQNKGSKSIRRSSRKSSEKSNSKSANKQRDGDIRNCMKQKSTEGLQPLDQPISKVSQASSDDYIIDDALFNDVEMQDAPSDAAPQMLPNLKSDVLDTIMASFESNEFVEDFYHTPPDSPSKVKVLSRSVSKEDHGHSPMKSPIQSNQYRSIPQSAFEQPRKRAYPAPPKPDLPRKVSRDNSRGRSFGASAGQSLDAMIRIGATFASSAWTTPNTSFGMETPGTSFDSTNEPFELEHPGSESTYTGRSQQRLDEPFGYEKPLGLGLDISLDASTIVPVKAVSMGPPALIPTNRALPEGSVKKLLSISPFAAACPQKSIPVGLRHLYELCRVSIQTGIPLGAFEYAYAQGLDDYETLWSKIAATAKQHGSPLPERSSMMAWKQCEQGFENVALTGSLKMLEQPGGGIFEFKLNPLKVERTYRLARKFGHDRFFVLSVPSIEPQHLPPYVRSDPNAQQSIIDWLVHSEHSFLGRKWRAFYVKPESNRKAGPYSSITLNNGKFRVYLFAENGCDFAASTISGEKDPRNMSHMPMGRKELIEWLMSLKINSDKPALKFFSRIGLGVSQTKPTIQFDPQQIIRSDNAHANIPAVRRLQDERSREKKANETPDGSELPVMNDGCARLSKAAAKAITEALHLDYTPSIFQGRIAGAKGVWMIDSLGECIRGPKGDIWIEITDSQLKFESARDNLYPDPERVTFEVLHYSKPLTEANLNFQLMTILAACKVPSQVFCDLLEADLTARVAQLEAAMESGLAIRQWNQEINPVNSERLAHGVEMHGGMPSTLPEKINWFVEQGFDPQSCCRLKDLLYKAIKGYCIRLENRMNIGVAKSTYAFMIADPLAVLEEGEVHIGFSTPFEHEMMLHDIDLLVARLPAALPSDIQKVRATFKVELKSYRDVIVFSSKGACSLAHKLSGGDYDGDKAWICWESRLVDPFVNAPLIEPPGPELYGIEKEDTTVKKLLLNDDYMDRFLRLGFDFNLQGNLLGVCTIYHESLCYQRNNINSPSAIKIAQLLGYLVDRAKAGMIFDDEKWLAFLKKEGLPKSLPRPAYKDKEKGKPQRSNLIDRLVFETAKGIREKALGNFSRRFNNVGSYDTDVVALYKVECEDAKRDEGIKKALADLKTELRAIRDFWSTHCMGSDDHGAGEEVKGSGIRGRRKSILPFQAIAEQVRDNFLAVRPSAEARTLSPIVARWDREYQYSPTSTSPSSPPWNHWNLLKASSIFFHHHDRPFIWYAAGVELGILKSQARGIGTFRTVVGDIWECFKVDNKAADRKTNKVVEDQGNYMGGDGLEIDEADEYGDWGWMEGVEPND